MHYCPALAIIQEIWGVNGHIRAVADQYALDGYVVLAPDVFWRQQPRVDLQYTEADTKLAYQYMTNLDGPNAVLDLVATGATDAAVCYYGGGIQNNLALAPDIQVPILFHYAELDDHIPADAVLSHTSSIIEVWNQPMSSKPLRPWPRPRAWKCFARWWSPVRRG